MSTNRTKIDWAYKQAQKIMDMRNCFPGERSEILREIAAILRRAKRRGERERRANTLSYATAWQEWRSSEEGIACREGVASGEYLNNRLWRAFMAGKKGR